MIRGNAVEIIRSAMQLGIYCRPVPDSNPFGSKIGIYEGEALKPSFDSFEKIEVYSNNYAGLFTVTPAHLLLDWELVTRDMLLKEYEDYVAAMQRSPF